jgi:tight adherence protein B
LTTQFFTEQAAAISRQLGVQALVPPSLAATTGFLDVTAASTDGQTVSYRTEITTLPVATPSPSASPSETVIPPLISAPGLGLWNRLANVWLLVGLAALFGGLAVLLVLAFASVPVGRSGEVQLRRRLAFYSLGGAQPVKESETSISLSDTPVGRSVVGFAGRLMQRRDLESVLAQRMESAGVPLKPAEWLLLHVGAAVVLALVLLLLFGGRLVPMLIGLVAGLVIPWAYLGIKEGRRHRDFQTQMPDALQLMAGSLSAGYSLPQAIDTVVREGQMPISSEFNRALVETRLGVPLEDALDGVAARMDSADFRWVVMALRIQRDVGGNLAEVLSTVSTTMRERARLNRQIQVLSAEGRLSAWILGGLPLAFIIYLLLVRPEYLEPLYTTRLGVAMILLSSVLLVVGVLWLRRAVKVEV